jgi:hypothetical protein
MTEAEWLTGTDPSPMLMVLKDRSSDRKRRLIAVASCRAVLKEFPTDRSLPVVNAAERFADDPLALDELQAARRHLLDWLDLILAMEFEEIAWRRMVSDIGAIPVIDPQLCGTGWLIRDIFGNPFRPVAFDPAWRSEAAVGIAAGIYEERAFERLPILADALQEAGCEHPDILTHCREPGTHVRGCWVVDLLFGKE